ncbi:MAG TPA: L-fucose:H+ symporter permease [Lentisphaeria bacterium]|nr:MAG: L-fucose:H+ symporter permease [Lentisphaerae bacterium GWF2_38_69]HBM17183.1 L-fucose:H+ symporter permease [Lentisphaeria bacterium]
MSDKELIQYPDGSLNKTPIFQFILLSILFPLWGAAASLNDILITQFKSVFSLSDFASALVQSAFYGGYFIIAIPASLVIKNTTYKFAILTGLSFYIIGCVLFFPASRMATYTMFLVAIFAIAIGLSFLETASNTYSSMIGPQKYATLRLNISQTFYPIGAALGIILGKYLVFQKGESLYSQIADMSGEQLRLFKMENLHHTLQPYMYLIVILVIVAILFLVTRYPKCKVEKVLHDKHQLHPGTAETLRYLINNRRFCKGIIAQFLYVGMQVTVWSFTLRLALNIDNTINERSAANFMIYSFAAVFIGKFIANFLMTKFAPIKVLLTYSVIGSLLLIYVIMVPNITAIYAAIAVSVLFGSCCPTIYAENIAEIDNKYREIGGAVVVMSIVGGAVIPAVHGLVSDTIHSMQHAFIVPLLCFIYVGYYFFSEIKNAKEH